MALGRDVYINELVRNADIVRHIAKYVELSPVNDSFYGECPLHEDKKKLFIVNPDENFWYCRTCEKGGDIFDFYKTRFNLPDFEGAFIKFLEVEGIKIPSNIKISDLSITSNEKEVLKISNDYFRNKLSDMPETFEMVLNNLGITKDDLKKYSIAYGGNTSGLTETLKEFGATEDIIKRLDLGYKIDDKISDTLVERIAFSVFDTLNNLRGFIGYSPGSFEYINNSFPKDAVLYGLNWTKNNIESADEALIVYDPLDAIILMKNGIMNTAAAYDSFTKKHANLIKRYSNNIHFLTDHLGFIKTRNSCMIAADSGLEIKISVLDDWRKRLIIGGPQSLHDSFQRMDVVNYILKNTNKEDVEMTGSAIQDVLSFFDYEKNPIKKALWINKIKKELNIDPFLLAGQVKTKKTDSKRNFNINQVFDMYVTNLLKTGVEGTRQYINELPVKDLKFINNKDSLLLYKILTKEVYAKHPQIDLALRANLDGQGDVFENQKINYTYNYLKSKFEKKELEHFPNRIFNNIARGTILDLEQSFRLLKRVVHSRKKLKLIEKIDLENDVKKINNLVQQLNELQ